MKAKISTARPITAFIESIGAGGEVSSIKIILPIGADIAAIKLAIERATNPDYMSVDWHVDDVHEIIEGLTTEQARHVLWRAQHDHDASMGINWQTLRNAHADLDFEPIEKCRNGKPIDQCKCC